MKKLEILYGELGNMYGEIYNPMFLEKATDEIELIHTGLNDEPCFVKNKVDMIYMSNIRDRKVYDVIDKLMPYKEKIFPLKDPFLSIMIRNKKRAKHQIDSYRNVGCTFWPATSIAQGRLVGVP